MRLAVPLQGPTVMGKEITSVDFLSVQTIKRMHFSCSVPAILLASVLLKVAPLKEIVLLGLEFAAYVSTVCCICKYSMFGFVASVCCRWCSYYCISFLFSYKLNLEYLQDKI
jgi:hypothetical protein